MTKKTHQNIIILSAENSHRSAESNKKRTYLLRNMLIENKISHGTAKGIHKGNLENSFVCLPSNQEENQMLKDFAFKNFEQDSVLEQDVTGFCHIESNSGNSNIVGKLKPVTKKQALKKGEYTLLGGQYYTIRGAL